MSMLQLATPDYGNTRKERPRILFVCFADSPHSQSWISLLKKSHFEVRVFASPTDLGTRYPPVPWDFPTYSLYQPDPSRQTSKTYWLLPTFGWVRPIVRRITTRYDIATIWLAKIIRTWEPDIVHSLSFEHAAYSTWNALRRLPRQARPKWVISSWGTEINFGIEDPNTRSKLSTCITECDGFIGDCYRDLYHAKSLGLLAGKLPPGPTIPTTGGIDLDELTGLCRDLDQRKLILVPKAYETYANKTLPIVEALSLCEDITNGYQIHLLMSSPEIQSYVKRLPSKIRERFTCAPTIPKQDVLAMYGAARVMIAPSLSDGTPNVMLEAMALGALPIMSPLSSIQEWINDGENGLFAHALYPEQIANALRRALLDDDLCKRAAQINQGIVTERANRSLIRNVMINYYQHLARDKVSRSLV